MGGRTFEARVFPSWTHGEVSGQVDFVASGPGIASGRVCEFVFDSDGHRAAIYSALVAPPQRVWG